MARRIRRSLLVLVGALAIIAAAVVVLWANQVNTTLTPPDVRYIALFVRGLPPPPAPRPYAHQVSLIASIQHAVLARAHGQEGIPLYHTREPKDLYLARSGLCYDRSRTIEKILSYYGFVTRHVAVYSTARTKSALLSLLTPGVSSHAVTEVRTSRGWMVIDSNYPWLALDEQGNPVPMSLIASAASHEAVVHWRKPPRSSIFAHPFTYVYGLYSRHGDFYPPYDPIPDVNYAQLADNF